MVKDLCKGKWISPTKFKTGGKVKRQKVSEWGSEDEYLPRCVWMIEQLSIAAETRVIQIKKRKYIDWHSSFCVPPLGHYERSC